MDAHSSEISSPVYNPLQSVLKQIRHHCDRVGRPPESVTLVGVTKTQTAATCREAHRLGVLDLGENYVQEWSDKAAGLIDLSPPIRWHFIGHLQTNKAARVVGHVHLIHTVDRPSLIDTLAQKADLAGLSIPVLLQVNIAEESTKHGCAPDQAHVLVKQIRQHRALTLNGLMTIGPITDNPEDSRPIFRMLRTLRDQLADSFGETSHCQWTHLSMGMSADFGVAIEEGATIVRVGTALFGHR